MTKGNCTVNFWSEAVMFFSLILWESPLRCDWWVGIPWQSHPIVPFFCAGPSSIETDDEFFRANSSQQRQKRDKSWAMEFAESLVGTVMCKSYYWVFHEFWFVSGMIAHWQRGWEIWWPWMAASNRIPDDGCQATIICIWCFHNLWKLATTSQGPKVINPQTNWFANSQAVANSQAEGCSPVSHKF